MTMPDNAKILAIIAACDDPKKLRSLIDNAVREKAGEVEDAARRRLYQVQAGPEPGTLAFDVWQSIHALEDALSSEAGMTKRLGRTRQKITRVGEERTVVDLALGKASTGYQMLIDRGWPELTFEAIALKHDLPGEVGDAARTRLAGNGVDVDALLMQMRSS